MRRTHRHAVANLELGALPDGRYDAGRLIAKSPRHWELVDPAALV